MEMEIVSGSEAPITRFMFIKSRSLFIKKLHRVQAKFVSHLLITNFFLVPILIADGEEIGNGKKFSL